MRICIISTRFYPQIVGSGMAAYLMAQKLSERGHEVTVITDSRLKRSFNNLSVPFEVEYIYHFEKYATGKNVLMGHCKRFLLYWGVVVMKLYMSAISCL